MGQKELVQTRETPEAIKCFVAEGAPTSNDVGSLIGNKDPSFVRILKAQIWTQVNIPPKPLRGGGGGVNLALSWECLSNKNRAFYMQRLAKLMRKDLNMVYLVSIVFRCFADPNEKYKYFL